MGGADELAPIVAAALEANPDVVEKIRGGNMKAIGVIIGHVMKETKGRADGGEVTRLVREQLGVVNATPGAVRSRNATFTPPRRHAVDG